VVLKRAEKLKIPAFNAIKDKARIVIEYSKKLKVELKDVAFLGNDINDIDALKIVGHPFGVFDCFPELNDIIIYKTKKRGGEGAVRELCDLILSDLNK
ncbi:MAG: 3-deoxy-D-manno-octulosonate 8-phosphate phosphatase, partial [Alphaproteobacteria bacterium]|nr:3-deoxy-D-manno-octulosonate 8-phosphate phosphatase [Alphaproteobacteria bacterium]